MRSIDLTLTVFEMEWAKSVGLARADAAAKDKRRGGLGPTANPEITWGHVRGAQCEMAASIGLNLFWRPHVGPVDQIDVGDLAEVRSTDLTRGCLIVKPDAKDHLPYVLVYQKDRFHSLRGWLEAGAVKRGCPLITRFGDPMHMADQALLHDIFDLKRRLHHALAMDVAVRAA